jgi:glucokinase
VIEGTVGGAANVPGFVERFSLTQAVGEVSGFPVHVTNDVTAAAIGEHRLGAGQGSTTCSPCSSAPGSVAG